MVLMPKLAWFTPLPPVRSGVAHYNSQLLPALALQHRIDVFVDGAPEAGLSPDPAVRVFSAHDFLWRHQTQPYDLIVYQLGNASCHDYMWSYLVRYPGLVVLHDGQLHHARGRMLLQRALVEDYRREFRYNHPDAKQALADLGAAGLLGSMTYLFSMLRVVVESSRRLVVHNHWLAEEIRQAHPGTDVEIIEMGVPEPSPRAHARRLIRSRHGIAENAVVFTALGKATPEKRLREVLHALASLSGTEPATHFLVAGESVDYYDMREAVRANGLERTVTIAGYVADEEVDNYIAASDVCVCLRWPTSRETSESWRRCLAAGKPTISTDLIDTIDVPTLDPRNWSLLSTDPNSGPVGVSIDILDELHSLRLAIRRLAIDGRLRETLGKNARSLWSEKFRLDQMTAAYEHAVAHALAAPPNPMRSVTFPSHLRATGIEHAELLLEQISLPSTLLPNLCP